MGNLFTYKPFTYEIPDYLANTPPLPTGGDYISDEGVDYSGSFQDSVARRLSREIPKRIKDRLAGTAGASLSGTLGATAGGAFGAGVAGTGTAGSVAAATGPFAAGLGAATAEMTGAAGAGLAEAVTGGVASTGAGAGAGSGLAGLAKPGIGIGGAILGYEGIRKGNPEKGALGGAMAGFSVGGPVGAVIGALAGGVGATFNKDKSDLSDKFEGRLGAISRGDYNSENRNELAGLFNKQAASVQGIDPELSSSISRFSGSIGDSKGMIESGRDLMERYLMHLEQGTFKFDSDANQYARSILGVMHSIDPASTRGFIERLRILGG